MKTCTIIILLTITLSLFSQNTKIDSLQQKLTHAQGSERILLLNDLAIAYWSVDLSKSILLAKEALRLSEQFRFTKARARTYNILGVAYFRSNSFKIANQYYDKCIATADRFGTNDDIYKALSNKITLYANGYSKDTMESVNVFKSYLNMSLQKNNYNDFQLMLQTVIYIFHSNQSDKILIEYLADLKKHNKNNSEILAAISAGEAFLYILNLNYFKAIEKYETALKLTKDMANKTYYLDRIGVIYFGVRRYKESVQYYNDALQLVNTHEFEKKDFTRHLLEADLGASYLQLKDYKPAIHYLQQSLLCANFTNYDRGTIMNNLGVAYLSVGDFSKADLYIEKALSMTEVINDKNVKLAFLNSKAELLTKKKQWNQLSELMVEISGLVNTVKDYYVLYDSYQLLSDYYEKSGNYKKSNEYLKKRITANESINNREFVNKISEFQFKYETAKKEQQITMQQSIIKQKDRFIVLSIIAGTVIFAALLVIYILYKIRNKAYKLLVYQSLKSTLNAQVVKKDDNTKEEDAYEMLYTDSALDKELKRQIEISLNKQLDLKVFVEPNLILKVLAEKCSTNRSYLSQYIHEQYNMNFNTFINMLRINEAKLIISDKNNSLPLKELYHRLGFNTYSVFNEAFKRHVGVTPAFYLKTVNDLFDNTKLK